jgi:hypothetical protein
MSWALPCGRATPRMSAAGAETLLKEATPLLAAGAPLFRVKSAEAGLVKRFAEVETIEFKS